MRNLFEKIIQKQADRLANVQGITKEKLAKITAEDIASIEV